jgi:membrane protein DedA with SNARE-associated domain
MFTMDWANQIILFLGSYTPIISFLGAIIGGEETLLLLSILAAQDSINIFLVVFFFYIGIMVADTLWYLLGKTKFFDWFVQRKIISKAYGHGSRLLDQITKGSDFRALFSTKFLYGLRIVVLVHMGKKGLTMKKFFKYNLIIDAIWTIVIAAVGWSAGKGIAFAFVLYDNIALSLTLIGVVLITFMILMNITGRFVKRWLMKQQEQSH